MDFVYDNEPLRDLEINDIEVIGNIYDNPELLKEEQIMISIEEIKEKQEELNKMIEEYESQKDLMSTWDKNWKPENGDGYYYIDIYNEADFYINESEYDEKLIQCNRIFQTKELAEKWLEIDTYLREKSFEPDWNDYKQDKYFIIFNYVENRFVIGHYDFMCNFSPFYFNNRELKEEIFKKYTTEELKFYFNIGE